MRVTEDKGFLTSMFPEVMKRTKLLIIDHDVCRYHSFDLLRYQLYVDTANGDKEHFVSLEPRLQYLAQPKIEVADKIRFMQNSVCNFNIYECFSKSLGVDDHTSYCNRVCTMLADKVAQVTPTDVSRRFDIIFNRKNIDGYILQYKGETNRPSCYDQAIVYEDENLLNLDIATAIVKQDQINAIMISSAELAVRLATRLYKEGYTSPITFMIARYAYNFIPDPESGVMVLPAFGEAMGVLETKLKHEFGFFDPFSMLTYRARYIEESEGLQHDDKQQTQGADAE